MTRVPVTRVPVTRVPVTRVPVTRVPVTRTWLYGAGASLGLLCDRLLGEPPQSVHPVALFGKLVGHWDSRWWRDSRVSGVMLAIAGVASGLVAGIATIAATAGAARLLRAAVPSRHRGCWCGGPGKTDCARRASRGVGTVEVLSAAAAVCVASAGRGLRRSATEVAGMLDSGDLDSARLALNALVGRDPAGLGAEEMARAVVESVAENSVDAVVAPALWGALAGAPGALAYRAVNTLDSMVGYRDGRYARFGWASARLDDVANWLPARLTAACVVAVRPRQARPIWRAVTQDAPRHPSPNAGVAEAAFAAALDLRLGGENRYGSIVEVRARLGRGKAPEVKDIARSVRLSRDVSALLACSLCSPVIWHYTSELARWTFGRDRGARHRRADGGREQVASSEEAGMAN